MPTRKQRRRREKLKRHEWEEVYVDEEGNELDPEVAEELAPTPARAKAAKAQPRQAGAGRRVVEPPSLRRTLRRGLLFFPLMLLTVFLLTGDDLTTVQKIAQAFFLLLIFLPFTHFMDVLLWRAFQRREQKAAEAKKR
jgi:cation transport ATPase